MTTAGKHLGIVTVDMKVTCTALHTGAGAALDSHRRCGHTCLLHTACNSQHMPPESLLGAYTTQSKPVHVCLER